MTRISDLHEGFRLPGPQTAARMAPAGIAQVGEIAELLRYINPDSGYQDWIAALMAIHAATGGSATGLDIADRWSARGSKYRSRAEIEAKWRSFKRDGVGPGTLAKMAQDGGADLKVIARRYAGQSEGAGSAEHGAAVLRQMIEAREAKVHGSAESGPVIAATPFNLRDPATIPRRDWLYGRHLVRHFFSVTLAPGGVGKSSLVIAEALAMSTGLPLLGVHVPRPLRVWLWNLEDPADELDRRFAATCQHYGVTAGDIDGRLFVDSGRVQGLCTARQDKSGVRIIDPTVDALIAEMKAKEIDVLIVDPFVSSHAVPENDNSGMDVVAKKWSDIADKTRSAIGLVHHTRKSNGGMDISTESGRGAKALTDAARDVRVINRMTEEEASKADVENHRLYFRLMSDKQNLSPPAADSAWHRLENVELANGDHVGVVTTWTWPNPLDGVTLDDLRRVQQAIDGKHYRENVQAKDWVGLAIADVLGLDPDEKRDREKVKACLKKWIERGALRIEKIRDDKGKDRPIVEVGRWAD